MYDDLLWEKYSSLLTVCQWKIYDFKNLSSLPLYFPFYQGFYLLITRIHREHQGMEDIKNIKLCYTNEICFPFPIKKGLNLVSFASNEALNEGP